MSIQKEREEFEKLPEIAKRLDVVTYSENLGFYHAAALNSGHMVAYVQGAWMAWQAKSKAVPEGFVLLNAESLALHAKSILMFNNGEEEDDYYEIENHACAIEAMIEKAQEQSHE